jgi:hypothetical protein
LWKNLTYHTLICVHHYYHLTLKIKCYLVLCHFNTIICFVTLMFFLFLFLLGLTLHQHNIGHAVTFKSYWWRKTSGFPLHNISGTSQHLNRTTVSYNLHPSVFYNNKSQIYSFSHIKSLQVLFFLLILKCNKDCHSIKQRYFIDPWKLCIYSN